MKHPILLAFGLSLAAAAAPAAPVEAPQTPGSVGSYLSARFARANSQMDAADRAYDDLLAENPERSDIRLKSIKIKLARGEVEAALKLASGKLPPDAALPAVLQAVTQMKRGDYARVQHTLGQTKPSGIYLALFPLLAAWATQDEAMAQRILDKAEAQEPRLGDLLDYHRGLMACQRGKPGEAAKRFAAVAARKESPFAPRARLAAAECGKAVSASEEAELKEDDTPSIGLKPRNALDGAAEALANAGAFAAVLGTRDEGYALLQLALYLHPDFHQARYELGRLQESEELLDEARDQYQAIPQGSPVYFAARTQLAKLYRKQGKTKEALDALARLAEERPEQIGTYLQMGSILREEKQYFEAAEAYGRAIATVEKLEPRHWPLYFFRGACLERAKYWDKAEADLKKALELKPDEPEVLNYLGYSWLDRGEHTDKAMEYIEKAVKQRPNEPHILDSYGWGFYLKNDLPNAIRYLERAVELLPHDPTVNDHLGDVYWKAGRRQEARFQWERALTFKPEKEEIPRIREKLAKGLPEGVQKTEKN